MPPMLLPFACRFSLPLIDAEVQVAFEARDPRRRELPVEAGRDAAEEAAGVELGGAADAGIGLDRRLLKPCPVREARLA